MKIIKLGLDAFEFSCPVTGEQVLDEDEIIPSPAMVFCYFLEDGYFQFANAWARKKFALNLNEIDDGYIENKKFQEIFLLISEDSENDNLLCYSFTSGSGPSSSGTVLFCFDQSYKLEDD